jgi:hypothetical protein
MVLTYHCHLTVVIQVIVSVLNTRDNNCFVKSIDGDIVEIIRREAESNSLKGFTVDKTQNIVSYTTKGRCQYRYGIEQHVQLSQQKIEV